MSAEGGVAVVLLAAGASTRMGTPKMLLPLDGVPVVRRAAQRAVESGAEQVVAVIPAGDAAIRGSLDDLPLTIVETTTTGGPVSASIHAGLDALHPETASMVVMLADMVHVTSAMLREVVMAARGSDSPLIVSRYRDVSAPPLAFPRRLFAELRSATGDGIGREVLARHRAKGHILEWPAEALRDLDTPEDYRDAQRG